MSFLPPLAPVMIPNRIALGDISGWEIALAAVLVVFAILIISRITSKIYPKTIMNTGERLSMTKALKLAVRSED